MAVYVVRDHILYCKRGFQLSVICKIIVLYMVQKIKKWFYVLCNWDCFDESWI